MATATEYIIKLESDGMDKIADFELTLSEEFKPFIVLAGDNGAGKTWLLYNIYHALREHTFFIEEEKEKTHFTVVTTNDDFGEYKFNYKSRWIHAKGGAIKIKKLSTYTFAYNANRLVIHSRASTAAAEDKQIKNPFYNPFDESNMLLNVEQWFILKLVAGREDLVKAGISALQQLMPNITKIDYERDDREGIIFNYHTEQTVESLNTLSAGNKVILALIGDLFFRLWDQQLDVKEAKDLTGIVIIDEIEAHLHPEWQRKFPHLLNQIFPKVQFVISTHTPMTILGLPKDGILLHVDTNEEGKITVEQQNLDYWNMLPQQILTAPLFGLDSLRSLYNEELGDVHTEEDYQTLKKDEKTTKLINEWAQHFKVKGLKND